MQEGNGMKSQFLCASSILVLMTTILLPLALTQTTKISLTPATEKTTGTSFANAQLKYLPTQKEAAQKAKDQSQTGGIQALLHQSMSIDDAVHDARAEEITAITSGHSELVAPEDLDDCKQAIMLNAEKKAEDAAKNAVILRARNIAQAQLKDQLEKNHCDSYVHIGITETCVFILMGGPLHTNDDELAGIMQLVYDHDYIYIDKNGRVENIQSSH